MSASLASVRVPAGDGAGWAGAHGHRGHAPLAGGAVGAALDQPQGNRVQVGGKAVEAVLGDGAQAELAESVGPGLQGAVLDAGAGGCLLLAAWRVDELGQAACVGAAEPQGELGVGKRPEGVRVVDLYERQVRRAVGGEVVRCLAAALADRPVEMLLPRLWPGKDKRSGEVAGFLKAQADRQLAGPPGEQAGVAAVGVV
jgi:hypothetical protein